MDMNKLSRHATPVTSRSMDMEKLARSATPLTSPPVRKKESARKASKVGTLLIVLLGFGASGAVFIAVKGDVRDLGTFVAARSEDAIVIGRHVEAGGKKFVKMAVEPTIDALLHHVPHVSVALNISRKASATRGGETPHAGGHIAPPAVSTSVASAPAKRGEAGKSKHVASARVTQRAAPASPQHTTNSSGLVPSAQTSNWPLRATAADSSFEAGDKLKILFYEHINDVEANKWGRTTAPSLGFQERPELSGDFAVQGDGTVSLPLLGSFDVTHHNMRQVQEALADAFKALTGHRAIVNIVSLERPPVYVLGPVQKPGSYKYVPGMTVLHAIALAGGLDRQTLQPWQRVEAVREVEKRRGAIETMVRLIARDAVLKSERDGTIAQPPLRLLELVSQSEARKLIAGASARRSLIVLARRTQERALAEAVAAAKQQVVMLASQKSPLDELIKLREEHVNDIKNFVARGIMDKTVLIQAQSELSDVEQRRQQAIDQYAMAQQRVALLEQDKAKFEADTKGELEREISETDQQITTNQRDFASSESVLDTLTATDARYTSSPTQTPFTYEIVRQTAAGPIAIRADGMTTLQPGDLVRIQVPQGEGPSEAPPTMQTTSATIVPPM